MFLLLIFKSFFSLLEGLIKNNCKQVRVGIYLFTYLVICHIICQEALCFFNLCMGMPIVLRSFCDLHVSYYLHSIRPTHTAYQSAFVVIQIKLNQVLCMFKILQWWSKPTGQNRQKISQQKYMHLSSEKVQILIQIIVELAGKCIS